MKSKYYKQLIRNIDGLERLQNTLKEYAKKVLPWLIKGYGESFSKYMYDSTSVVIEYARKHPKKYKKQKDELASIIKKDVDKITEFHLFKSDKFWKFYNQTKEIKKYQELTRSSCIILLVSFIEAYLKDYLISAINRHPSIIKSFMEKEVQLKELEIYNFNLSKNMGNIIVDKVNFFNINEIENNYKKAFNIMVFQKSPSLKRRIAKLFQDRHLLIHNNGKIDRKYISIVKCDKKCFGKKIKVTLREIEQFKNDVKTLANIVEGIKFKKFKTR